MVHLNRISSKSLVGFVFLIFSLFACDNLRKKTEFQLQPGDLLFQDLDDSALSDAIEKVTQTGKPVLSFSHVGMFVRGEKGEGLILEAISKGVCLTPLDSFLMRSRTQEGKPKVVVGRMKQEFQKRIPGAIRYGKQLLGKAYDPVYSMKDSTYYCSELMYEMLQANQEKEEVFHLNPMTFKDPETGEFYAAWVEHYQKLGVPIPEGEPGLNPNGMSQSENIDLIYSYVEGDRKLKK